MELYLKISKMNFEEDAIEHNIIRGISDNEFFGYDEMIDLDGNDQFIKNTLKIFYKKDEKGKDTKEIDHKAFIVREQKTWWNFPLYEFKDGKIIPFDYNQYAYFFNTNRRMALAGKINQLYNPSSEAKLHRKTLKTILDYLGITDEGFQKYNTKVEAIIKNNPKT